MEKYSILETGSINHFSLIVNEGISNPSEADIEKEKIKSVISLIDKFPNGFEAWVETHHVMVENIERMINNHAEDTWGERLYKAQTEGGMGGVWLLCRDLTDKFEQENIGVEWDGNWFEAIDAFLEKELA